ncbi:MULTISPECIES: hypothetical protein [unclassified Bradyrhizobium]|uniref:hypothetical protein n=1 Tax=unclassified Bradyrhizobium TaxID=2631580 RepID=UPI003391FB22
MADPAEQQPAVDKAAELEAAVRDAIETCGGDPVDAVRALILMNTALEQELAHVYARASCRCARTDARRKSVASVEKPLDRWLPVEKPLHPLSQKKPYSRRKSRIRRASGRESLIHGLRQKSD